MNKPTKKLAIAEATGAIRAHLAHLDRLIVLFLRH